jgi:hypothetical protein
MLPWTRASGLTRAQTQPTAAPATRRIILSKTPSRVSADGTQRKTTVRVVQCQYWKREQVHMVATAQDEQPQKLNDDEFEDFKLRAAQIQESGRSV